MFLVSFFKKVFSPIINFFTSGKTKEEVKKIAHIANLTASKIADLANVAMPIIKMITDATPNKADDAILTAAHSLGTTVASILSSTDEITRDGGRLKLAAEALRNHLIELVRTRGKVEFQDFTLRTMEDVMSLPKGILMSACQDAYTISNEIKKI